MAESRLVEYWQNNAPCSFSACTGGQVRTCGDVCVTPVTVGNACSQTDCASTSVCETGASCVTISGQLKCAFPPTGMTLFSDCSGERTGCPHDLFCRDFDTCTSATGFGERCSVGSSHGHSCDSDWDTPDCWPCMPGTDCTGATGNKKCRKSCSSNEDCPCGDSGAINGCNPEDAYCYRCVSTGEACNENTLCCDTGTYCGPISQVCCPEVGTSCTDDEDCCSEHICRSNGTCNACIADSQSCTSNDDCCSELCSGGQCVADCTNKVGQPCTVPMQAGECAKGTITCTNGIEGCSGPSSSSEICDDKDNDCDGKTDEGVVYSPSTCSTTGIPGCESTFEAQGVKVCEEGSTICRAEAGVNFCVICDQVLPGSQSCGYCVGSSTQCTTDSQCAPGAICLMDSGLGYKVCQDDPMCSTTVSCWLPSDNGTCP
ncbi:MAG: hypothetical protein IPM54_32685 [Polyangiaceae bacterium]|nr:hypothetical protein [Polyangiaceae bacterium]